MVISKTEFINVVGAKSGRLTDKEVAEIDECWDDIEVLAQNIIMRLPDIGLFNLDKRYFAFVTSLELIQAAIDRGDLDNDKAMLAYMLAVSSDSKFKKVAQTSIQYIAAGRVPTAMMPAIPFLFNLLRGIN